MNLWEDWVEYGAFILLIIGFILAALAGSAVIQYMIIFLCGLAAGRLWYRQKNHLKFPWVMILTGFLMGYVLGSFYGDKKIIVLLFIIGGIVSYYVHDKGYIKTIEY